MKSIIKDYQPPRIIQIPGQKNETGSVHFWEDKQLFPRGVQRCFWISGVKAGVSRGNHAHWEEAQVIVAVAGELEIQVEGLDRNCRLFKLGATGEGLLIPPLNWVEIRFSQDAILLGLGDREYSEEDFIREKDHFGNIQKRDC